VALRLHGEFVGGHQLKRRAPTPAARCLAIGWLAPCQEGIEIELLTAGRGTLRVSDASIQVLAATLQKNRTAREAHEALVERVARQVQHAGRVVWRCVP
jgi:hypothetical protein